MLSVGHQTTDRSLACPRRGAMMAKDRWKPSRLKTPGMPRARSAATGSLGEFKSLIARLEPNVLAPLVTQAVRSPQTPSLEQFIALLYPHLSKRRRADLLNSLLTTSGELRRTMVTSLGGRTKHFTPTEAFRIPVKTIAKIIAAAGDTHPAVIDEVVRQFAHNPKTFLRLDAATRRVILSNAREDATLRQTIHEEPIVEEVTVGDTEGPMATSQAAPAPKPRYAAIQVFADDGRGRRGEELTTGAPIRVNQWYQAEFSIRVKPIGLRPKTEPRPIREPKQSKPVVLIVTAEADPNEVAFEIAPRVSKIVLPPTGDSTEQAIFRLKPLRISRPEETPFKIRFRIFYRFNLLEKLMLESDVLPADGDDEDAIATPRFGLQLEYGKLRQSDANDFDVMTPCVMHIDVVPYRGQYQMTFSMARPSVKELAFTAVVLLTDDQLAASLSGVRKALFEVCSSDVLGKQIDGDVNEYQEHLKRLVKEGRALWLQLFDRGLSSQEIAVIGQWLKSNPLPPGSKIQVSTEAADAKFVFAWNLLYDGASDDDAKGGHPQGFWGLRYVIEQRTILALPPAPEPDKIEIAAMYWKFDQTPDQQQFLRQLLARTNAKAEFAGGSPIDEARSAQSCLERRSSQILYFYTHGYTAVPDGERYGVTVADFKRLYNSLPKESETRKSWRFIYKDISDREFKSDSSWIELSAGRLDLLSLYHGIDVLPAQPFVILNMCDSAQVTPWLSLSFIDFFLSRGARAIVGTECSIRPVFADFVGRRLLRSLLAAQPIGDALLQVRVEAVAKRNLLGLAYTLFGAADAALHPAVLPLGDGEDKTLNCLLN